MRFTCNICGNPGELWAAHYEDPERPSCPVCLSNTRFRWLVHRLSTAFFGRSLPLKDFPADKDIRGIGLTDPEPVANILKEKFTYLNTFLDCEPRLDIRRDQSPLGPVDFLIASEVFEHVEPPVRLAFENAARILKPGGILLLTVPWVREGDPAGILPEFHDWKLCRTESSWAIDDLRPDGTVIRYDNLSVDGSPGPCLGCTREHFPHLKDWNMGVNQGEWTLLNRREDGVLEVFRNLCFHSGPGLALEMRLFTGCDLERHLSSAGFDGIRFDCEPSEERGIVFPYPWSHPVIARKRALLSS